jgi:hypothetical protein
MFSNFPFDSFKKLIVKIILLIAKREFFLPIIVSDSNVKQFRKLEFRFSKLTAISFRYVSKIANLELIEAKNYARKQFQKCSPLQISR